MKAEDIAHWPGTPGEARIALAEKLIDDDPQGADTYREGDPLTENAVAPERTYRDAGMVLGLAEMFLFGLWSEQEIERLHNAEQLENGAQLLDIAEEGSNDRFIGMVIETPPEKGREEEGNRYVITILHRDPEWVGLNPYMSDCQGLELHLLGEWENGNGPRVIAAVPPGVLNMEERTSEPHGELVRAIREVAAWHGAKTCLEHRWSPETPPGRPGKDNPGAPETRPWMDS